MPEPAVATPEPFAPRTPPVAAEPPVTPDPFATPAAAVAGSEADALAQAVATRATVASTPSRGTSRLIRPLRRLGLLVPVAAFGAAFLAGSHSGHPVTTPSKLARATSAAHSAVTVSSVTAVPSPAALKAKPKHPKTQARTKTTSTTSSTPSSTYVAPTYTPVYSAPATSSSSSGSGSGSGTVSGGG